MAIGMAIVISIGMAIVMYIGMAIVITIVKAIVMAIAKAIIMSIAMVIVMAIVKDIGYSHSHCYGHGVWQGMLKICEDFASSHSMQFSTDPIPYKSKSKCLFFSRERTADVIENVKLNVDKLFLGLNC